MFDPLGALEHFFDCPGPDTAKITAEFILIGLKINFTCTGGLWMDSRPLLAESLERWRNTITSADLILFDTFLTISITKLALRTMKRW